MRGSIATKRRVSMTEYMQVLVLFFSVSRGVRQGCPLSPYLFVICVELLAIAVRNDKNIVGIDIGGECFKIIQYADDRTLTLTGGPTSIRNALSLFESFKSVSGLRINLDKTEIVRIGKYRDSDIYNNLGLKSVNPPLVIFVIRAKGFRMLGK